MPFLDALVVGSGVALLALYANNHYRSVDHVEAPLDGKRYVVRRASDSLEAANMLARINREVEKLISHMEVTHGEDERVVLLRARYHVGALSEGAHDSGYTSYSVNKGERIVMCLRSRSADGVGDLEKFNTLMYVVLHELAHLATEEVGHTPLFWKNFRFIVENAEAAGVYIPVDYSEEPEDYCGMTIRSNVAHTEPASD